MREMKTLTFPDGETYEVVDAEAREDLRNLISIVDITETEIPTTAEMNAAIASKSSKVQIDYLGGKLFKVGDTALNFADIYNYHITKPDFTFIVYGNRAYLCSFINYGDSMREMRFESVINSDLRTKTSSIYIVSSDGTTIADVSVSDINSENSSNKVSEITEAIKTSAVHYPSTKAVAEYTKRTEDRVGELELKLAEQIEINKKQSRDILNLKAASEGKLYRAEQDTSIAYLKSVPEDAMPVAALDKFAGVTIVMNQLNDNLAVGGTFRGVNRVYNGDGTWTYNGTATTFDPKTFNSTPFNLISGHVYMFGVTVLSGTVTGDVAARLYSSVSLKSARMSDIYVAADNYTGVNLQTVFYQNTTAVDYKVAPWIIDLTVWFGADIAQSISTVEQAYSFGIPREPIAYDLGTVVNSAVESITVTGVNLCKQAPETVGQRIRDDMSRYTWIQAGTYKLSIEGYLSDTGTWGPALYFKNDSGEILTDACNLNFNVGNKCNTLGHYTTDLEAEFTVYVDCYMQFALISQSEVDNAMIVRGSGDGVFVPYKSEKKIIPDEIRNLSGYGETGAIVDIEHGLYTAPDGSQTDISSLTGGLVDIEVERGGTIMFEQASGLKTKIPSQITYLIKLGGTT